MMFAARKLQGIGLIVLLTVLSLLVYSVNLQVSTTRTALRDVQRRIADLNSSNRLIEGDIAVLANARQLDQWNRDYFGLQAAAAGQYVQGERALAQLDRLRPVRGLPTTPVQTAMANANLANGDATITRASAHDLGMAAPSVRGRRDQLRTMTLRDFASQRPAPAVQASDDQ